MRTYLRWCCAVLVLAGAGFPIRAIAADPEEKAEKLKADDEKKLKNAIRDGRGLKTDLTVKGNVHAQAVLIPQVDARRIFGKEIAVNYAVIAVTIGNKSPDAALIVHGAYIDYSQWGLKGGITGKFVDNGDPFTSSAAPNHVSSVESRLVRGQLLDAQQWTARNWTIRLLTLAGSIASGYSFAFKEAGIGKTIAAFNGNVVPGVATAWPDATVQQLNRISDFGFQTNKVIARQGSDIMVCFFPIDRFLTPGFRKLFLKSPAIFFSPLQMLYDQEMEQIVQFELASVFGGSSSDLARLRAALPCYLDRFKRPSAETTAQFSDAQKAERTEIDNRCHSLLGPAEILELDFINQMSLNTITVVVDGTMSVDVNEQQAKIDTLKFEGDDKKPEFWAAAGTRKASFEGSYLTGGKVEIVEAKDLGITDIVTLAEGSSDRKLWFSFKLSKAIEAEQVLHFSVAKTFTKDAETSTVLRSNEFGYQVAFTLTAPTVTKVHTKDGLLQVSGTGFFETVANKLSIRLLQGKKEMATLKRKADSSPTLLLADIPEEIAAGCYQAEVKVGTMPAILQNFAIAKLTSAARKDGKISITGEGFKDASKTCSVELKFELQKGEVKPVAVDASAVKENQLTLTLPAGADKGDWKVRMLVDQDEKGKVVDLR